MPRSSASAVRPDSSMAASASPVGPACGPRRNLSAPACTTITETECATTSCISRAIRSRSAWALSAAAVLASTSSSAARAACWAATSVRRRTNVPAAQAPAQSIHGQKSSACPSSVTIHAAPVSTAVATAVRTATRPRVSDEAV